MHPILAMLLSSMLPIIQKQINAGLFRFIEREIEDHIGFEIPGDIARDVILQELDTERGWSPILIATPQWLFSLAVYAVQAKFFTKGG